MTSYHQSHTEEQIKKLSIKCPPHTHTGMGFTKEQSEEELLCKSMVMQFVNSDELHAHDLVSNGTVFYRTATGDYRD